MKAGVLIQKHNMTGKMPDSLKRLKSMSFVT